MTSALDEMVPGKCFSSAARHDKRIRNGYGGSEGSEVIPSVHQTVLLHGLIIDVSDRSYARRDETFSK